MSEKIRIDLDDLPLGDLEEFERETGVAITAISGAHFPMACATYLVYLDQRRRAPEYTLADARKVRLREIELVRGDDEQRPTDPPQAT